MKSEPSYGDYAKKDLYTPYYPDPPQGRGMIGNLDFEKRDNLIKFMFRRNDGLRASGRDGGAHTGVLVKAFTISRLSGQVPIMIASY